MISSTDDDVTEKRKLLDVYVGASRHIATHYTFLQSQTLKWTLFYLPFFCFRSFFLTCVYI